MNQIGDKCLIKSKENCLYLFHIALNRYSCILKDSSLIDFFSFLDKNDSSILVIFRNKELRIITQNGNTMQRILSEERKITDLKVDVFAKMFMVVNSQDLSFYKVDHKQKNNWTLWKRMFPMKGEQILRARLVEHSG